MKHTRIIGALVLALVLGAADAQTRSAPGQYPGLATLKTYVQQGLSIALVSSDGRLVAVVNADGTVTVAKGADLSQAAAAIVKSEQGKALVALQLAATMTSSGVIYVQQAGRNGTEKVALAASAGFKAVYAAQVKAGSQKTGATASDNGLTNTSAGTGATSSSTGVGTAVETSTTITVPTVPTRP